MPDLERIGRRVLARVTRVEHHGVYLQRGGAAILVLIVDVAREPIADLRARYRVGDELEIRVVAYIAEHELFKGSLLA